jgi:hypothetical protein
VKWNKASEIDELKLETMKGPPSKGPWILRM